MLFKVAKTKTAAPTEIMRIGADGNLHITGSIKVSGTINSIGVDTDTTSTIDGGSF